MGSLLLIQKTEFQQCSTLCGRSEAVFSEAKEIENSYGVH